MTAQRDAFTATELKAGALVLAAVVVLSGFVVMIRGCPLGEDQTVVYHTRFTDVGGLGPGAVVRFGGVEVGKVAAVDLDPEDPHRIRVTARVRDDVPVNAASVATVTQVSLTSEKHLEISVGDREADRLSGGASIPSTGVAGGLFDVPDVEGVILRVETLLDDIIELVGVDADGTPDAEAVNLSALVASLDELFREVTTSVRDVRSWLDQEPGGAREIVSRLLELEEVAIGLLEELRGVVEDNREPLAETAENLAQLTRRASATMEELSESLESTLARVEGVSAEAGVLMAGQRPAVEEIVENLQRATRDLRELSRRLSDNPSLLIRGGAPPGRSHEEDQ